MRAQRRSPDQGGACFPQRLPVRRRLTHRSHLREDKHGGGLTRLLEADYTAWGEVRSYSVQGVDHGSDLAHWPLAHGFAGGLLDRHTGLVRFGARDYEPSIGRWTSSDPILFNGGQVNLYVYVGNDPGNRRDPRGLATIGVGVEIGGCAFGACGGVSGSLVGDDSGSFGGADFNFSYSVGFESQALSASAEVFGEFTNAASIADLEGWERYGGVAAGELLVGGIRAIHQGLDGAGGYYGVQPHFGVGVGLPLSLELGASKSVNLFAGLSRRWRAFWGDGGPCE